jgi:hypothetical protein
MIMFSPLQNQKQGEVSRDNFGAYALQTQNLDGSSCQKSWNPALVRLVWTTMHQPGAPNCIAPVKPVLILLQTVTLKLNDAIKLTV